MLFRSKDIVQLLLSKGALTGAVDKPGRTQLHYATLGGDISVVEILLLKGASTEIDGILRSAPLHPAVMHGLFDTTLLHSVASVGHTSTVVSQKVLQLYSIASCSKGGQWSYFSRRCFS